MDICDKIEIKVSKALTIVLNLCDSMEMLGIKLNNLNKCDDNKKDSGSYVIYKGVTVSIYDNIIDIKLDRLENNKIDIYILYGNDRKMLDIVKQYEFIVDNIEPPRKLIVRF
mgnify:CR=1 FL=1